MGIFDSLDRTTRATETLAEDGLEVRLGVNTAQITTVILYLAAAAVVIILIFNISKNL